MNCTRCLRPVQPGARWCSFCGEPVQPVSGLTQPLPEPQTETVAFEQYEPRPAMVGPDYSLPASGAAIAALIFAITGLVGPLPLIGSLLALGFASRARRESAYGVAGGEEMARAARIVAWTSIILLIVAAVAVGAAVLAAGVTIRGHLYKFGS